MKKKYETPSFEVDYFQVKSEVLTTSNPDTEVDPWAVNNEF